MAQMMLFCSRGYHTLENQIPSFIDVSVRDAQPWPGKTTPSGASLRDKLAVNYEALAHEMYLVIEYADSEIPTTESRTGLLI